MGLLGIGGGGGGIGGLFGGGNDKKADNGEQGDGEEKVSFAQVYQNAIPEYLTGKKVYEGDKTTKDYYKTLKHLNGGGESQATFISYDA